MVDVSGSMGDVIQKIRETLVENIDKLDPLDRFAVFSFDEKAYMRQSLHPVEKIMRKNELPGLLSRFKTKNCTALYDSVVQVVRQIRDKEIHTSILVFTDEGDNASTSQMSDVLRVMEEYPKVALSIVHYDASNQETVSRRISEQFETFVTRTDFEMVKRVI